MKLFATVASFLALTCSAAESAAACNDRLSNYNTSSDLGISTSFCSVLKPTAVYNGSISKNTGFIKLRIANGAAGQTGLIKALADAYIKDRVKGGELPFEVAWYKSDTTKAIEFLQTGEVDVAITYNEVAESIAIDQSIAESPSYFAFRENLLLVGPPSNPANLSKSDNIFSLFSAIYNAAEGPTTVPPVRFLSRYDKSIINIKETFLWATLGQVPWATAYSTWYHQYISIAVPALNAAIKLDEYTITDRATLLSLSTHMQNQTVIYKVGSDNTTDPLMISAHLLIGKNACNAAEAAKFASWLVSTKGQDIVIGFKKKGEKLYTGAPVKE
ncbi:hypothetical protein QQX98_012037 [Neonectria punicea]|uniref:PBP domain-containing protein n=1 Tax=Neonectria punicea TaxID=979145 RepID=A0ABR1GK89_9HYPO